MWLLKNNAMDTVQMVKPKNTLKELRDLIQKLVASENENPNKIIHIRVLGIMTVGIIKTELTEENKAAFDRLVKEMPHLISKLNNATINSAKSIFEINKLSLACQAIHQAFKDVPIANPQNPQTSSVFQ